MFGVVAINIARRVGPHAWFYKFWPLIMFLFLVVGAIVSVIGMIGSAIKRRKKSSN